MHTPRRALRLVMVATGVAVTGVLFAPAAQAYKLGGQKWPTRTITYNAGAAPKYAQAIRRAVRAWNASGVNVRFRAASRRRARLRIFEVPGGGGGEALLGWAPPSRVTERRVGGGVLIMQGIPLPCGTRVPGTGRIVCTRGPFVRLYVPKDRKDPFVANDMAVVVAHELGHVLGLKHVRGRCALMTPTTGFNGCRKPPEPWQLRCRLLEADDVRGAIRRYGGRMRPLAPEFCEASPAPGPPSELVATFDPAERSIHVSWRNPTTVGLRFAQVVVQPGGCPPPSFEGAASHDARPGERSAATADVGEGSGPYCVAVLGEDAYGRTSAPAITTIDVPPPADEPEPGPRD